ncbi:hypothetical protein A2U01_0105082, partial [Trifolium medium]|nr:hypothetical protein [Trifolium medium]
MVAIPIALHPYITRVTPSSVVIGLSTILVFSSPVTQCLIVVSLGFSIFITDPALVHKGCKIT